MFKGHSHTFLKQKMSIGRKLLTQAVLVTFVHPKVFLELEACSLGVISTIM